MVNTYTKGNRVEKRCRELFEKEGWLTWKPSRAKYNSNDAFGLFDCILIREGAVMFMQVKSHINDFYTARKTIARWHDLHKLMITVIVSVYEGDNVWRIEWYDWMNKEWIKYPLTKA